MVGLRRESGSLRALFSRTRVPFWAFAVGCGLASCSPTSGLSIAGGGTAVGGNFGGIPLPSGFAGSSSCQPPMTPAPVFASQMFPGPLGAPFEYYVWVPAADAAALRTSKKLFASSADAGVTRRLASLPTLSYADASGPTFGAALQTQLQSGRLAWAQPWANRMLLSAANATLVHVTLRADAWLAVIDSGSLVVYDNTGTPVPTIEAFAHPERVGALYFDDSQSNCEFAQSGTNVQRGFIVGNEAELKEWSLGTPEILQKMQANIADLTQLLNNTRSCPPAQDPGAWMQSTPCDWQAAQSGVTPVPLATSEAGAAGASDDAAQGGAAPQSSASGGAGGIAGSGGVSSGFAGGFSVPPDVFEIGTEQFAYDSCLVTASSEYFPAPAQIAAIIDTMQGDLFESNPLVVTPGSP